MKVSLRSHITKAQKNTKQSDATDDPDRRSLKKGRWNFPLLQSSMQDSAKSQTPRYKTQSFLSTIRDMVSRHDRGNLAVVLAFCYDFDGNDERTSKVAKMNRVNVLDSTKKIGSSWGKASKKPGKQGTKPLTSQ